MKKVLPLFLVLIMLLSACIIAGCNSETARYAEDEDITKYIKLPNYENITVDTTTLAFNMKLAYNNFSNISQLDLEIEKEGLDDGFVEVLDTAIIDYEGKKDGVPFEGGSDKGFDLVIGSGSFIEGFEEGLVGVKVGETVDLKLKFPDDYQEATLAGKDVVFTVTVKGILRPNIPKVTDEMAGWLGYESAKVYNDELKQSLVNSLAWESFMTGIEIINMPDFELERYYTDAIKSLKEKAEQEGSDYDAYLINAGYENEEAYLAELKPYGESYIKIKLAAHLYAQSENLSVTEKEIDDFISSQYDEDENISEAEMRKIKDTLLISKVNENLRLKIKVK